MQKIDILTHKGAFHIDEVLAVAMIKLAHPNQRVTIIRTRDAHFINKALSDPSVYVVDIGRVYDPSMRNFDHHQDPTLPSAAALVFSHLHKDLITPEIFELCGFEVFFKKMYSALISYVDGVDSHSAELYGELGRLSSFISYSIPLPHLVIKGLNINPSDDKLQMKQFEKAVDFMAIQFDATVNLVKLNVKSEKSWERKVVYNDKVLIIEGYCDIWKSKIKKDRLSQKYVIQQDSKGWRMCTIDDKEYPIPAPDFEVDDLVHYDRRGHLVIFKTKSSVLRLADYLI